AVLLIGAVISSGWWFGFIWRHFNQIDRQGLWAGSLAAVAAGTADDLIARAADVVLKERRTLIVVPRETPLSRIHLRNLSAIAEAGGLVLPACPGFYQRPHTLDELVDFVVGRVMDHLQLPFPQPRWGGP
ncbi:MAG: UbiX family flavin prenyltransferase, partial [Armatimonadota bacterium]|nr:UbiX family flavin prenyltransferase [Armatimonadota bacterium]